MSADGLSIRPQLLQLSPHYRRARDSILRPHLRLTESRYFWEKWKPRLGPDAALRIMEVRERCNRALGALGSPGQAPSANGSGGAGGTGGGAGAAGADGMADGPTEGTTVSAAELAAACGFSRVTLWRLLQREDVRQFVRVEHNYVYDRRIGKKRRTVSTYHVLMEDPLVPEDEPRLAELLGGQSESQLQVQTQVQSQAQPSTFQTETKVVDKTPPTFQSETTESGSNGKQQNVQTIFNKRLGATAPPAPPSPRGGAPSSLGSLLAGELPVRPSLVPRAPRAPQSPKAEPDIWVKYPELAHHIEEVESLLGDRHSRGFYITALKKLYPQHMGLWQRALGLAREQTNIRRSRGALFTRLLRTFAAEAGVPL
jgi:hypothetical protein